MSVPLPASVQYWEEWASLRHSGRRTTHSGSSGDGERAPDSAAEVTSYANESRVTSTSFVACSYFRLR